MNIHENSSKSWNVQRDVGVIRGIPLIQPKTKLCPWQNTEKKKNANSFLKFYFGG